MNTDMLISGFTTVVESLEKAITMYPNGQLDMLEGYVQSEFHSCGTFHCFAGWFGVVNQHIFNPNLRSWHYVESADYMATLCGMDDCDSLKMWARDNPTLWGNEYGERMFLSARAFNRAKNLQGIVDHLKGVISRLKEVNT